MTYLEMMKAGVHVYTSVGQQVAWVREAAEVNGGVTVKILVPIVREDGRIEKAAIANDDVVEAVAFIAGGVIR